MKIVHLLHYDGPGGGPPCIAQLVAMLGPHAEQVVISGGRGLLAEHCARLGVPYHDIGMHRRWRIIPAMFRLFALLKRIRPDTVFVMGQWAGVFGAPVARWAGVKRVLYAVHYFFPYVDWDLRRVVRNRIIEAVTCRCASRVIALSPGTRYQLMLRRLAREEDIVLIPNAFDPARVPAPAQTEEFRRGLGWADGTCHVVSVGRLSDQKRVDWLLKSWALVEKTCENAALWIVGGGPEEDALKALAAQLGLRRCTFMGPQPDGIRLVAAADLVAMTTLYEMHALLPLEAMGCGRAIVASAVDGVASSIRDGVDGMLVAPGDIGGFAAALRALIQDPAQRAKMGEQGRRRAAEFHPDGIREKYLKLLEEPA